MKILKYGTHLKVKDIDKSYNFYKLFDLKPVFAYGRDTWIKKIQNDYKDLPHAQEKYDGITFEIGGALFEIANGHVAVKDEVFKLEITSSKISAMFDTDSVKDIEEICNKNKIKILVPITKYYWGTVEIVIKDPDGYILVFREKYY